MSVWSQIEVFLRRLRGVLAVAGLTALFALAVWLRHLRFSADPVIYSYLQIVGSLLCVTYAATALVRFRGTHDRRTLILAFGFAISGVIETVATFHFYDLLSAGTAGQSHVALSWMVSRTLLAMVLIAALFVEWRIPKSRDPERETAIALLAVVGVAYLTSVAYLGLPSDPVIHPHALLARPWDLFPATLFAIAGIGFWSRGRRRMEFFDCILGVAIWMNVACHLIASQSQSLLDAPFALAQAIKVGSYALVLAGALLENARLFEQVRHLAVTDSLTGLSNYRTLINVIEAEIQRSRRTGRPFAILLLDLDGLKSINDRHGHLVGTGAICRLARVLRVHSRTMDTAARYGGDEFALVLPEAGREAASLVSQRIRERLASDGEAPHITVSVGAAVFPQDGDTLNALFNSADRALYGMKGHRDGIHALARIAACL